MSDSISVVIPTYNRATLVTRAIESALRQVEEGDEILVVDDGSTDDTARVVARYGPPVRYILAPHGGCGAARNRGIAEARNALVALLDSDDEWLPGKLAMQRAAMHARPDVVACFSDFQIMSESGGVEHGYLRQWFTDPRPWSEILGPGVAFSSIGALPPGQSDFMLHTGDLFVDLIEHGYVSTFTAVFRKDCRQPPILFPLDMPIFEDWEFFAKLARCGAFTYLDCETAIQHGHSMPRITDTSRGVRTQAHLQMLERVWGSDEDFLARHGDRFHAVRARLQVRRRVQDGRALLKEGRIGEARAALSGLTDVPWKLRLLLLLPDFLLDRVVAWRAK